MVVDPGVLMIVLIVHSFVEIEVVRYCIWATVTVPSLLIGGLIQSNFKPILTTR